jgi:hypothetical protein
MSKEQATVLAKRGVSSLYGEAVNLFNTGTTPMEFGLRQQPKRKKRSKDSSNTPFLANRLLLRPSDYRNKNKLLHELLEGDLLVRENQIYDEDNCEYESILPLNCLYDYCLEKAKLAYVEVDKCRNIVNDWIDTLEDDDPFIDASCCHQEVENGSYKLNQDILPFDLRYLRKKFEERPSNSGMKTEKTDRKTILEGIVGNPSEFVDPQIQKIIDDSRDLLFYLDYDCISKLWSPDGINIGQGDDYQINELTNEEYGPLEITSSCILGDRLFSNTIDLIKLKKRHKIFFTFKQFQGDTKGFGELVRDSKYNNPAYEDYPLRPMIPTLIYGNTVDEAIHTLTKKDGTFEYPVIKYLSYDSTNRTYQLETETLSYDLLKYIGVVRDIKDNSSLRLETIKNHERGKEPKNLTERMYAEKLRLGTQKFLCFLNTMK